MKLMALNKKTCIICLTLKDESAFNKEHVIPESIGGKFVINSVCESCNVKLGSKVDTPLVNHKIMLINRHELQINRGNREIANPFKGTYARANGDKYFVQFNKEGKAQANLLPKFEDNIFENSKRAARLTLSKRDINKASRIIGRELKDRGLIMVDDGVSAAVEKQEENLILRDQAPNHPIIFGALKIAFEFCHEVFPDYYKDHFSEKYREILLNPVISDDVKSLLQEDTEIKSAFGNRIMGIGTIKKYHHLIFLTPIKNKGTYCLVKLFQMTVLFEMSSSELIKNEVILLNDAKEGNCGMYLTVKLKSFELQVISYNGKSKPKDLLSNSNGQVPVFDEKGKQLYDHLDQLLNAESIVPKRKEFTSKRMELTQYFSGENYYLKTTKDEVLLKVESIKFDLELVV
jgi:hypothetical protein